MNIDRGLLATLAAAALTAACASPGGTGAGGTGGPRISVPVPVPPCSSSKRSPNTPWSRNSSTTSQGNSCDASISAARGAIRSRASVRTWSRSSRCSSVSTSQGTRGV